MRPLFSRIIPALPGGFLLFGVTLALLLPPWGGFAVAADGTSPVYDGRAVFLSDGKTVLGVMPEAGGRVVHFGLYGGRSVLNIDARLLSAPVPEPSPDAKHYPLNGHEVWVGPQSEWWSHQELNADRKARAASWPPDPWISIGRFSIVKRDASSILMEGPVSPVTGLQMTKEASILPEGSTRLKTSAKNCRDKAVRWELWSNTRLDGGCRPYSPVSTGKIRFDSTCWNPTKQQILQYEVRDGFFTFKMPAASDGLDWMQKAYFKPDAGTLCAFGKDFLFVKSFEPSKWSEVHPTQAPVEIYQCIPHGKPEDSLLELEFHGAYRTLEPGESMSIEETWRVFPYDGDGSMESHLRLLKSLGLDARPAPAN